MIRRALVLLGLFAAGAAASAALSMTGREALSCASNTIDIGCRLHATFSVAGLGIVTDNYAHKVTSSSYVRVSGSFGAANIFFRMRAKCQMTSPTSSGTKLLTRAPVGYLFTQSYGKTLCTFSDGTIAVVTGAGKLKSFRTPHAAEQNEPFFAALEAIAGTGIVTQLRALYTPRASFAVAVYRGRLLVRLPDDKDVQVNAGQELVITLSSKNFVRSTKTRRARFTSSEVRVFKSQSG
jgi:hypothetical protein